MEARASAWLIILLALLAANLPFLTERYFMVVRPATRKGIGARLLELLVYAACITAIGMALEARRGQVQAQGWAFYAVLACVFCTLAFPGFVWRYLKRHRSASAP
jgi:hypothetical protein